MIYHITLPTQLAKFNDKDYYEAESLHLESFIHCSTLAQLKATANRYYSNADEIVIFIISEDKLVSELKYEMAKIGEEFPHIYGPINKSAILEMRWFKANHGEFHIDIV